MPNGGQWWSAQDNYGKTWWVDGGGEIEPGRLHVDSDRPIELAKNRAATLLANADAALEAGVIDEAEWYRRGAASIEARCLISEHWPG